MSLAQVNALLDEIDRDERRESQRLLFLMRAAFVGDKALKAAMESVKDRD